MIDDTLKLVTTLATTVPTFFMRLKPTSSMAKPACMNITSTAATTTHTVSAPTPAAMVAVRSVTARAGPGKASSGSAAARHSSSRRALFLVLMTPTYACPARVPHWQDDRSPPKRDWANDTGSGARPAGSDGCTNRISAHDHRVIRTYNGWPDPPSLLGGEQPPFRRHDGDRAQGHHPDKPRRGPGEGPGGRDQGGRFPLRRSPRHVAALQRAAQQPRRGRIHRGRGLRRLQHPWVPGDQ